MKNQRLLLFVFILLMAQKTGSCQFKNGPTEDSMAPPIVAKESLDNNYAPGALKNKFIILDFWATWCAPCIAGFPHFNGLADKFSDNKNVLFATMTDEDRKTTELFFTRTRKELRGIRLLDEQAKTMNAFSVKAIPLTVVIDDQNIIKWKGTTEQLKETTLDSILNKIPFKKEDKKTVIAKPYLDPAVRKFINGAAFGSLIMKSTDSTKEDNGSGSWANSGDDFLSITYYRKPLIDFLGFLLGKNTDARFIVTNKQKGDFKIDVFFEPHKVRDSSFINRYVPGRPNTNYLIHLLSKSFKFNFRQENKVVKGYRFVITDSTILNKYESTQTKHASESDEINGTVEIVNHSINDIAVTLEDYLKSPIKNETGTNKRYDITLNVKNIAEANKQLANYGLILIETTNEPFEVVYIDF